MRIEDQVAELVNLWIKRHGRTAWADNVTMVIPKAALIKDRYERILAMLKAPTPPNVRAHVLERLDERPVDMRDWWKQPIDGWPHQLSITSIMTGETTVIDLKSKEAG